MGVVAEVDDVGQTSQASNGARNLGRGVGTKNISKTLTVTPVASLPAKRTGSGFQGNQELANALVQIKQSPGTAYELFTYDQDERSDQSARGTASALRKKYPKEEGWEFRVGPSVSEPGVIGLFVQYG